MAGKKKPKGTHVNNRFQVYFTDASVRHLLLEQKKTGALHASDVIRRLTVERLSELGHQDNELPLK